MSSDSSPTPKTIPSAARGLPRRLASASLAPSAPNILIIRPSALGDVSRTVPALVAIRQALPQAKIDWLVHDAFVDAIRHHPALDSVVPFPRKRFGSIFYNPAALAEFLRWSTALRRQRYDLVFDLQGLFRSGLFTRMTNAPHRVGYANARELAWLGYNHRHHVDRGLHTVDRMLALVAAEGFPNPSEPGRPGPGPNPGDMQLYVGPDDNAWLDRYRTDHGLQNEPFFTIAPTARWLSKCWPIDRYIETTRRLLDTGLAGKHAFILASPSERPQIQPLLDAFASSNSRPETRDSKLFPPPTTVGQMMAILSRTRLLICNDSAPLHIAVGFNRPIVAVFGPTDPSRVGPYHRPECVVQPSGLESGNPDRFHRNRNDASLIARVSVEAVWERITQQIR